MTNAKLLSRYQHIQDSIGNDVQLIAVSKYTSDANIETLLAAGHLDFGESKPQNLRDRAKKYPQARWHMIGPLQKNKAKYVGKFATMWHACCDLDTAQAVAKHVTQRRLPTLIQVNISGEIQKQGVSPADLPLFLEQLTTIQELEVIGFMGMAAKDTNARPAFALLKQCRAKISTSYPKAHVLCMGMSNDWRIAIKEEATMIRVGSEIFGLD